MAEKEKLSFTLNGKKYSYDGFPSNRERDLFDLMIKTGLNTDLVIRTYRENMPENSSVSDEEMQQRLERARAEREQRRQQRAGGAASPPPAALSATPLAAAAEAVNASLPAPVSPAKEKLSFVLKGKKFSYDGFVSNRERDLFDLMIKTGLNASLVIQTYRDNMPDNATTVSDDEVQQRLVRARTEREQRARGTAPPATAEATAAAVAPGVEPTPRTEGAQDDADVWKFIKEIVDAPSDDVEGMYRAAGLPLVPALGLSPRGAGTMGAMTSPRGLPKALSGVALFGTRTPDAPPTEAAATGGDPSDYQQYLQSLLGSGGGAGGGEATAEPTSPRATTGHGTVRVYLQQEGEAAQKVLSVPLGVAFEDFAAQVEKKLGARLAMFFVDDSDTIEVDDNDSLSMFLSQRDTPKLKLACVRPRQAREDTLTSVAAAATGASGSASPGAVHKEMRSFTGHSLAVYCVAWSRDGERFVTASRDKTVRVWNATDGSNVQMNGGHSGIVLSCDFSPSGEHVVSCSENKQLKLWNATTGERLHTLKGHSDKVYNCKFSPTGAYIVSCSADKGLRVWNANTGGKEAKLDGHTLSVFGCGFSNTDGGKHVVSAGDDKSVRIWDWREGRQARSLTGHTGTVWSCRFSNNDRFIVSASMDHEIKVWDVGTGLAVKSFSGHMMPIHDAMFSPDDKYIVSCGRDWSIIVWDAASGTAIETLTGHRNTVYRLDIHKDKLLSCSLDESVKIWPFKYQ